MEYTVVYIWRRKVDIWQRFLHLKAVLQGETVEETLTNVKEAIEAYILELKEEGNTV